MKQPLKYLVCIFVTLILSVGVSWVIFQRQAPKYYGVEKVVLTRFTMQDGKKEKTVTEPEDVAEIVDELRRMVIQRISDPDTLDAAKDILFGVPSYKFEFYMTDGTTYSCSHMPGNGGSGSFSDSEGRQMTVQMGSAKLWRIMNYEEVSINS